MWDFWYRCWVGADATEIATVLQAFKQINKNIEMLNENLDKSTKTLGALVKSEYAGELARLGKSVNDLVQKQDALAKTVGEKQEAVRDLYGASQSLQGQDVKLSSVTRDLEKLVRWLNGIVARPAARAEQRWYLWRFAMIGFGICLNLVLGGLLVLPDRAETAVARMIMGDSYWGSAWRMMEANDPGRYRTLGVLTWIDTGPEEAEKHTACRDRAWESGEHQECVVVFYPRSEG